MRSQAGVLAVVVSVGVLVIAVAPARARTPGACDADVEKLCNGVEPGAGRVFACLRSHGSQLTPACKQALKDIRQPANRRRWLQQSRAWAGVCSGDIESLCQGIPAGAGRIAECLQQHQAKLSDPCKAAFLPTPTK